MSLTLLPNLFFSSGTRSGISWVNECVAESLRVFPPEEPPPRTIELPSATFDGIASENCFSPPVVLKGTRALPVKRTARHNHREEFTSTAGFCGAYVVSGQTRRFPTQIIGLTRRFPTHHYLLYSVTHWVRHQHGHYATAFAKFIGYSCHVLSRSGQHLWYSPELECPCSS